MVSLVGITSFSFVKLMFFAMNVYMNYYMPYIFGVTEGFRWKRILHPVVVLFNETFHYVGNDMPSRESSRAEQTEGCQQSSIRV